MSRAGYVRRCLGIWMIGGLLVTASCASGGGYAPAGGGRASRWEGGDPGGGAAVGRALPDVAVRSFEGRPVRLSSLRGKVVLLNVWASWCAPCKEEMPLLDDIAARLRGQAVEVIAVSVDEDRSQAEAFLRARRRWALTLAHDPEGVVADRLQPATMPTSYIIDTRGLVRDIHVGFHRGDAPRIEARLRALARAR